jgi:hypothetical protein
VSDQQSATSQSKRVQKFTPSSSSTFIHRSNASQTNTNPHQYSAYHAQSSAKNQSNGSIGMSFGGNESSINNASFTVQQQ